MGDPEPPMRVACETQRVTPFYFCPCLGEDRREAARPAASTICERDATADPHGNSAASPWAMPRRARHEAYRPSTPPPRPGFHGPEPHARSSLCASRSLRHHATPHAPMLPVRDVRCVFGPDRRTLEDALVPHIEAAGPLLPMLAATGRPQSPGESHAAARRTEWT